LAPDKARYFTEIRILLVEFFVKILHETLMLGFVALHIRDRPGAKPLVFLVLRFIKIFLSFFLVLFVTEALIFAFLSLTLGDACTICLIGSPRPGFSFPGSLS
ncbi:MAG: hypothetical protein GY859_28650, partial [Desulfobacterales bacterium]|nr:hypothetical protein [Desulfobacterales bacterium]